MDETMTELLRWVRNQIVDLCEATEDSQHSVATRDLEGKQGAFARGRIHEAKGIRNTMAEIIRAKIQEGEIAARDMPNLDSVWIARDGRRMRLELWIKDRSNPTARMEVLNPGPRMRRYTEQGLDSFGTFLKPEISSATVPARRG